MRLIIIIILISFFQNQFAQECRDSISKYFSIIDTAKRDVAIFVDEEPEILKNSLLSDLISNEISNCAPKYCIDRIRIAFIVETDSTLSNIIVCPKSDKSNIPDIDIEENRIKHCLVNLFQNIKTSPAKKNGIPIARFYFSIIIFECMD